MIEFLEKNDIFWHILAIPTMQEKLTVTSKLTIFVLLLRSGREPITPNKPKYIRTLCSLCSSKPAAQVVRGEEEGRDPLSNSYDTGKLELIHLQINHNIDSLRWDIHWHLI